MVLTRLLSQEQTAMKRRHYLASLGLASAGAVAGCSDDSDSENDGNGTDSSDANETGNETDSETGTGVDNPTATLQTTAGEVEIRLFDERAPNTVENFVGLATGDIEWTDPATGETRTDPLYDDVLFHRVIDGFMVQTGDPTGTGRGGPGYEFDDEFHPELRHDSAGIVSMANSGPDTNGSQFFITLAPQPHLDDRHSVFGEVIDGMDVVEEIGSVETDGNDRPVEPVVLESVTVDD